MTTPKNDSVTTPPIDSTILNTSVRPYRENKHDPHTTEFTSEAERNMEINTEALDVELQKYKDAMKIIVDEFVRVGDPAKKDRVREYTDLKKGDEFISNFKTLITICQQLMLNNETLLMEKNQSDIEIRGLEQQLLAFQSLKKREDELGIPSGATAEDWKGVSPVDFKVLYDLRLENLETHMMERLKQAFDIQVKLARTENRMTVLEENIHRLHVGKSYKFPPPRDANDMIRINVRNEKKQNDVDLPPSQQKLSKKHEKFTKVSHNMLSKLEEAQKLIENFQQLK
jgi:hypothetical protein